MGKTRRFQHDFVELSTYLSQHQQNHSKTIHGNPILASFLVLFYHFRQAIPPRTAINIEVQIAR
jgi:hypothetical protein